MAIDPEIEEVLSALIDTVEERVGEVKTLLSEQVGTIQGLQARVDSLAEGASREEGAISPSSDPHP